MLSRSVLVANVVSQGTILRTFTSVFTRSAPLAGRKSYSSFCSSSSYPTIAKGAWGTPEWRLHFTNSSSQPISPWHDVPLIAGKDAHGPLYYYVNEIPKGTRPKMEIATKEANNPIKQDVKKGALRIFKYGDLPFNYGALPQTWEDPNEHGAWVDPKTQQRVVTEFKGDNDPIDVVEVSGVPVDMGKVITVRLLGAIALLDEGEMDWKILAIGNHSPLFNKLFNEADLVKHLPEVHPQVLDWFRNYKTVDGKPQNSFGLDGYLLSREHAHATVQETHEAWKHLIQRKKEDAHSLWTPAQK